MANIILRSLSVGVSSGATTKNGPLTNLEGDANFNNLNAEKIERNGSIPMTGTLRLTGSQLAALRFTSTNTPASLQNGDMWLGIDGILRLRHANVTYTLFSTLNLVGTANQVILTNNSGTVTLSLPQDIAPTSAPRFRSLGVGTAAPALEGRIEASNDIVAFSTSDQRLKTNILPILSAVDKVQKIQGVTFDWNSEHEFVHGYQGRDVGVIAQQVQAVLPEAVQVRDNGYLAVDYKKLIPLLLQAVTELSISLIDTENEVRRLRTETALRGTY